LNVEYEVAGGGGIRGEKPAPPPKDGGADTESETAQYAGYLARPPPPMYPIVRTFPAPTAE